MTRALIEVEGDRFGLIVRHGDDDDSIKKGEELHAELMEHFVARGLRWDDALMLRLCDSPTVG